MGRKIIPDIVQINIYGVTLAEVLRKGANIPRWLESFGIDDCVVFDVPRSGGQKTSNRRFSRSTITSFSTSDSSLYNDDLTQYDEQIKLEEPDDFEQAPQSPAHCSTPTPRKDLFNCTISTICQEDPFEKELGAEPIQEEVSSYISSSDTAPANHVEAADKSFSPFHQDNFDDADFGDNNDESTLFEDAEEPTNITKDVPGQRLKTVNLTGLKISLGRGGGKRVLTQNGGIRLNVGRLQNAVTKDTRIINCAHKGCRSTVLLRRGYGRDRLLNHAKTHLKSTWRCRFCDYSASTEREVRYHHKKKHEGVEFEAPKKEETVEDFRKLLQMFRTCFPGWALKRLSNSRTNGGRIEMIPDWPE